MVRNYISKKYCKSYIMTIPQNELHDFEKYCKETYPDSKIILDLLEHYIHGIYNGFTHDHPHLSFEEMKLIVKLHKKFKNGNDAIWITLSPDHLKNPLPFNVRNLQRVKDFCMKWFDSKRYSFYHWVIESGENKDDPHLHVHALVQFRHRSTAKNHARDLKNYWSKKVFNDLKGSDYYSQNVSGIYQKDKLDYMNNHAKGSHENFCEDPFDYLDTEGIYHRTAGKLN